MTDVATLKAEARALATFGAERYEDGVVYDGVGRFLGDVGGIPAAAWGTLPFSDQWRRDWDIALANRISEAALVRTEMDRMADGLIQISANYAGTDLRIATSFDLVNRDLGPYVAVSDGYVGEVSVRRGGAGVVSGTPYRRMPDDEPVVTFPSDNKELNDLRNERYPTTRETEEPITIGTNGGFSGGRTTSYVNGAEDDALNNFVQNHRDVLLQLEGLLIELGTHERLPLTDLLVHAWRTCPKIIRNRSNLVNSAANTYAELRASMDADLKRLKLYWEGTAATAFAQYVDSTITYLTQVEAQAKWLAEEGRRAATALEGLRNAYAEVGHEHVSDLIQALQDYQDALTSPFGSCSSPEQALVKAVSGFVDYLEDAERRSHDELASLIKVSEQERKERPDIGSRAHDMVPFPQPAVGPTAWADERGWQPNPRHPLA
jgi:uncharacterized protein YukE